MVNGSDKAKKKLSKYFTEDEIHSLFIELEDHQRAKKMNDKYFVKIGRNNNELFFSNLEKELTLYKENPKNKYLPKLIDSFHNKELCLIVLERIKGKTIGKNRNNFRTHLSEEERKRIAKSILKIKDLKIKTALEDNYNREEKLDKYLEKSKEYIDIKTYNNIIDIKKEIIKEEYPKVVAHGDLINTNILINSDNQYLIDWEYISLKPKYYDLIYFSLFSKKRHSVDLLYEMNLNDKQVNEALKDGIIICLKEIKNNAKLFGLLKNRIVKKSIKRWRKELVYILKEFE